ncbi:MAG: glucose-1-phosphate adenylyltransferase, partial [Anaerotignaceae bacterium]
EDVVNVKWSKIYNTGITVVGEKAVIPNGVTIGKNCVVFGETVLEDYPNGILESGNSIIKGGVEI